MTNNELIAALEKATGADRALDAAIARATGWKQEWGKYEWMKPNGVYSTIGVFEFTASIDAALTLVPVGWHLILQGVNQWWHADLRTTPFGTGGYAGGFSSTSALAICIAALRARKEGEGA